MGWNPFPRVGSWGEGPCGEGIAWEAQSGTWKDWGGGCRREGEVGFVAGIPEEDREMVVLEPSYWPLALCTATTTCGCRGRGRGMGRCA